MTTPAPPPCTTSTSQTFNTSSPPTTHDQKTIESLLSANPLIFPSSSKGTALKFSYGTAGFRYPYTLLPPIFIRMGIFACIRSASCQGDAVGLMCTASHNPPVDNGIKISDPDGGMLHSQWESCVVFFGNASDEEILSSLKLTFPLKNERGMEVHIGRDTRSHSKELSVLAATAATALGAKVVDHGVVTTPMLHHCVRHANGARYLPGIIPVRPLEEGYFDLLRRAFLKLEGRRRGGSEAERRTLWMVDAACGVGYEKVSKLYDGLKDLGGVELIPVNGPNDGVLNENCGAEYVQKCRRPPLLYERGLDTKGRCGCSLDGDADRIVFWYHNDEGQFRLLDGDKIAVLAALFLQEELQASGLEGITTLGVVQTAYANGASTAFLREKLHLPVVIAKTGVKHLHHAAQTHFDVGIYFEANGHGTILFNPMFYTQLQKAEQSYSGEKSRRMIAIQRLRVLPSLINQAVGDALSDLLLVAIILQLKGWNFEQWYNLYRDLPSHHMKVPVLDRKSHTPFVCRQSSLVVANAHCIVSVRLPPFSH